MAISTILSVGSKAAKIAKGIKKASDYLIKNKVKRAQKTPDKKFKSVNTDTKTYVNPRNNRTVTTQKKDLVKGSVGKKNYIREMKRYHYKDMDGSNKIRDIQGAKKGMSVGQAKIAAKAPPPNVINEKDFAVLRAEKAKGRGMGLQDEKVQPGKVMKARLGSRVPQVIRPKPTAGGKPLKPKPIKPNKKMGGGMMMQRPMAMSGYKKGTMVKARGCKLGRTRPTKIT